MRLILITQEQATPGESAACCALFDAGLELLHLRKPSMPQNEMATWLEAIPVAYHDRIVLHDHFALAGKAIKRIHLNSRNPYPPENADLLLSCSFHSLEELKNKTNLFEYFFLSPIFNSVSKQGYMAAFPEEQLIRAHQQGIINPKVIALGGIGKENLHKVAKYGFGGVALIGNIWGDYSKTGDIKSLIKRYKELQTICNNL